MSSAFNPRSNAQKEPGGNPAGVEIVSNLFELGLLGDITKRKNPTSKTVPRGRTYSYPRPLHTPGSAAGESRPSSKTGHRVPRSKRGVSGMIESDRSRTRRDRTFVGTECAVCDEPLEHTLRGERILQLSCAHVAHEQCFYEYIREFESQYCPSCNAPLGLDSSRGGNVLDLGKLSNSYRTGQYSDSRDPIDAPQAWQAGPAETQAGAADRRIHAGEEASSLYRGDNDPRSSRSAGQKASPHNRNNSQATSTNDFADMSEPDGRRHDYDVQSMETKLSSPRTSIRNPIPPPIVTVRSEFPTLMRSRQQQSLTCLVTIEVSEGKWRPDPEDMPGTGSNNDQRGNGQNARPSGHTPKPSEEARYESPKVLETLAQELSSRVDNWHGLDPARFGKLRLHGQLRVGKDRRTWQDLECYLFSEMLICVREKKASQVSAPSKPRWALKGSILIKKHLQDVEFLPNDLVLTLSLSVPELPAFHLQFRERSQLDMWRQALDSLTKPEGPKAAPENETSTDEDELRSPRSKRMSASNSSFGAGRSYNTAVTEYTDPQSYQNINIIASPHVPLDLVVVIPISSSMQGLKISILRDALRFLVASLGHKDRMGLVTFGSSGGGVPIVGMTSNSWNGWSKVLESIRPVGQKSLRADVVEGANVAMDLLMQRKSNNPVSSILLISDSSTSEPESVDFVVSRAEAAKVVIHSFGLGLTHKPDTMIELSTRTKAAYTYVKDWNMLRESVAGCLGALQTISHQNVKLKLRLPEGSPAKFSKISGALQITKRAAGRDAEASLGDLRFGDKRDVLVQLAISPDSLTSEQPPQDAWETIVSGLEALGSSSDQEESRALSIEEVPLIQADLIYGDILREGANSHLPRPSLLAITMLPHSRIKSIRSPTLSIPAHPAIVQRRMELLTSDMLTRALTLVSKGQHERAHHLLSETRSILKGLAKGGLPPLPPPSAPPPLDRLPPLPPTPGILPSPTVSEVHDRRRHTPSPHSDMAVATNPTSGIDAAVVSALDAELEASLEWINHPAVFGRDSRKAVLQAIGVISSQRGYTSRMPIEAFWADRIKGTKKLLEKSRDWREAGMGEEALVEEA